MMYRVTVQHLALRDIHALSSFIMCNANYSTPTTTMVSQIISCVCSLWNCPLAFTRVIVEGKEMRGLRKARRKEKGWEWKKKRKKEWINSLLHCFPYSLNCHVQWTHRQVPLPVHSQVDSLRCVWPFIMASCVRPLTPIKQYLSYTECCSVCTCTCMCTNYT